MGHPHPEIRTPAGELGQRPLALIDRHRFLRGKIDWGYYTFLLYATVILMIVAVIVFVSVVGWLGSG